MSEPVSASPLSLQIAGSQWQYFSRRRMDPRFSSFAEKVWQRDHHTCQYCGFSSLRHMEVVNRDGNYLKNTLGNMVTSCFLCTPCLFLEAVGQSLPGNGVLIYLPDMTQVELNALSHVLMQGMVMGSDHIADLRARYRSLRLRTQLVEKHMGEGFSDVAHYVRILSDIESDQLPQFQEAFDENIRLLPDVLAFSPIIQECGISALSADPFTQGGA